MAMPPEDNASSDFEFDSWAREFKLARSTTSILRREGCEDHTALTSLTRSDVLRLDLPVGQCRLLMVALADLGNKNTADFADSGRPEHEDQGADQPSGRRDNCEDEDVPDITSVRRQAERLRQAGERLDNLSGDEERVESRPLEPYRTGRRAVRTARMAGPSSDPRMLLTVKSTGRKAVQITAFLQEEVKNRLQRRRRDRMTLTEGADGTLSIRTGDVGYTDLTWDEWSGANIRLLAHLLETGELRRADMEYYLAYTSMVYDLAGCFEWASVLRFDTQYRELQAQHGFVWGAQASQLEMRLLVPKASPAVAGNFKRRTRQDQQDKAPNTLCKMFAARGSCRFGSTCRFRHVADMDTVSTKND